MLSRPLLVSPVTWLVSCIILAVSGNRGFMALLVSAGAAEAESEGVVSVELVPQAVNSATDKMKNKFFIDFTLCSVCKSESKTNHS